MLLSNNSSWYFTGSSNVFPSKPRFRRPTSGQAADALSLSDQESSMAAGSEIPTEPLPILVIPRDVLVISWEHHLKSVGIPFTIANLTSYHCQSARYPAKNDQFFAGERRYSHFHTKRLVRISRYPCKIDLGTCRLWKIHGCFFF